MSQKYCTKCGILKDFMEFAPNSNTKDKHQSNCRACNRLMKEELRRSRGIISRKQWQENLAIREKQKTTRKTISKKRKIELIKLLGGKCFRCGLALSKEYPSACFEFHHPNGQKDKTCNVGHLLNNQGKIAFLKEVQKCQLFCANCHRAIHYPASETDSLRN